MPNSVFVLEYELAPDSEAQRERDLPDHLQHSRQAADRGDMILGGVVVGVPTSGLMIFRRAAEVAEDFAKNDPFVTGGSVSRWRVREWHLSIGSG